LQFDQNLRVQSALRFLNKLKGRSADWEHVRQLAERLNLDLKPAIRNLSKGNKQKVGVIQAMMHKPELLMLDEPTFGLDPLVQQEVLYMIREAQEAGATVFFCSHILSEVQEISDRVGIIRNGVVVEVAQTKSLINRSIRRVRVRFKEEVNIESLEALPGVEILGRDDSTALMLQVSGEMDILIKTLAAYPVIDLESQFPTLEEIFLAYYQDDQDI
jgi:ABC-2 type transport system ATP-binding protein